MGPLHGVGAPVDLPDLLEGFVVNHSKHLIVMIGLLVVGATLFFSGFTGGWALFLLWPLACVVMMVFMMRGMGGMHGNAHAEDGGRDAARPPMDTESRS